MIQDGSDVDLLIVVPPQASTMANGPPLAPLLLEYFMRGQGVTIGLFDANAYFHRRLLRTPVRRVVGEHWRAELERELQKPALNRADLSSVGRSMTWLASDYCRGRDFDAMRAGFEWLPVQTMMEGSAAGRSTLQDALQDAAGEIEARRPRNVAFSVMFHEQRPALLAICRLLRQRGFRGKILIGGALVKLSSDLQLQDDLNSAGIDLAFRFNLYGPQPELAGWLRGEVVVSAVPHGSYLDESRTLRHVNVQAARVKTLAGALRYDLKQPHNYLKEWIYPVLLSEGCYWGKCDFCDYPYLASQDPFVVSALFRDPAFVREDIVGIRQAFGVREIDLISDAVPMGYFARLAKVAGDTFRALDVRLSCSIRAEPKARAEHFKAMKECGVHEVTIGVEALSDEVLSGMKKGNSYEDILRAMRFARDSGIGIKANLIFDHPRLRLEHVDQTLERLEEISEYVDCLGVHSFALSPHAPIAHDAREAGIVILRKKVQTDHGDHHLGFRRLQTERGLPEALAKLQRVLQGLAFRLDRRRGAFARNEVFGLPFRWAGDRAVANSANANLFLKIPGESEAFSFIFGEGRMNAGDAAQAVESKP